MQAVSNVDAGGTILQNSDDEMNAYFEVHHNADFRYGYKLIVGKQTLLQKLNYNHLSHVRTDIERAKQYGIERARYIVSHVKVLGFYSVSLLAPSTELIGFKSGFVSREEAEQHIITLVDALQNIDYECRYVKTPY